MGLPPTEVDQYQGAPARTEGGRNILSYWLREPYYMARWTYFHRPSVWNAVGGQRGLTWHGLYGFKTLLTGAGGVSYTGGARTVPAGMRWLLRGGAGGFEAMGAGFTQVAGLPYRALRPGRAFAQRSATVLGRLGAGFRTGGVAGALRGVGATRVGTLMEQVVGGTTTRLGRFALTEAGGAAMPNIYSAALRGGISLGAGTQGLARLQQMETTIGAGIRRVGIGGLVRPRRYATRIVQGLTPAQQALFTATGRTGRTALTRGIMARGGARLMAGAAVGLNIALFGSMLGSLAYGGARRLGEEMWNLQMNRRVPALEFGRGVTPFPEAGSLTERQRAVQQIQASHLNARSFLGSEARLYSDQRQY